MAKINWNKPIIFREYRFRHNVPNANYPKDGEKTDFPARLICSDKKSTAHVPNMVILVNKNGDEYIQSVYSSGKVNPDSSQFVFNTYPERRRK